MLVNGVLRTSPRNLVGLINIVLIVDVFSQPKLNAYPAVAL
jgi:hypothetical protein